MIIDSSAVVAILNNEPEAQAFAALLESADSLQMAAPTLVETSIVVGSGRQDVLDELLRQASVTVVPFGSQHTTVARTAYLIYGRRSGSPARLNYGDCFSYALAIVTGEPLLYKGDDFTHTDVIAAL